MSDASRGLRIVPVRSSGVLSAHDVNLSIFNAIWLVREGILEEADISTKESLFTPALIRIPTSTGAELLILQDRIQLSFDPKVVENAEPLFARVLGGIVAKLPHTPYSAVGLNAEFLLAPRDETEFGQWNRKHFSSLFSATSDSSSDRFGCYLSTSQLEMQVRVECRPARIKEGQPPFAPGQEAMHVSFNFHRDLAAQQPALILQQLAKWSQAEALCTRILARLGSIND